MSVISVQMLELGETISLGQNISQFLKYTYLPFFKRKSIADKLWELEGELTTSLLRLMMESTGKEGSQSECLLARQKGHRIETKTH